MLDVVGIGLNAIDYLVRVPRFPVPGEKLRMSAFAREGGGQVATALVALSRWGRRRIAGPVGARRPIRRSAWKTSDPGRNFAPRRASKEWMKRIGSKEVRQACPPEKSPYCR